MFLTKQCFAVVLYFVMCSCVMCSSVLCSNVMGQQAPETEKPGSPYPTREWTSSKGKKFKAKFSKVENREKVILEDLQGKEISISIFQLSDKDIYEVINSLEAVREEAPVILELNFLDTEVEPMLEGKRPEADPKQPAKTDKKKSLPRATAKHLLREWTDASGKRSFKATFSKVIDESKVVLIDEAGKELEVPLSKLCFYDIYYAVLNDLAVTGKGYTSHTDASGNTTIVTGKKK